MQISIIPQQGLNILPLGSTFEECVSILGQADRSENMNVADEIPCLCFEYEKHGITLFFTENRLNTIQIFNNEAKLFDKEVFSMNPLQIRDLLIEHGIHDEIFEKEDWGEVIYTYCNESLDFIFEEDELMAVSIGE